MIIPWHLWPFSLLKGRSYGFGRCCWEYLWRAAPLHFAGSAQWNRSALLMDGVPVKQAALSWMALSFNCCSAKYRASNHISDLFLVYNRKIKVARWRVTRHWNPILWLALVTTMKIHQVSIRSECWWYQPEYLSGQKCPFAQCCSLRVPLISQWLKIVQELLHRQFGLIRSCKLNWMVYNHQQTPHF